MSPLQTAWYKFVRGLVKWLVFKAGGGMRVSGIENIPKTGAIIFAPNHASYFDPPLIACSSNRIVTFMAKEELFNNRIFASLIRSLGAFPVRRGAGDLESIRLALSILEGGNALLVFPEGTRNRGEYLHPLNRGVEMLARKSGAHVVPVGLTGTETKWGKGKKPRWGGVKTRFGKPLTYEEYSSSKDAFSTELARRILELCHADGNPIKSASENPVPSENSPKSDPAT